MGIVMTPPDLARMLGWSDTRVRGWLRTLAAEGHPLVAGHGRFDRWRFTADETTALAAELARRAGGSRPAVPEVSSTTRGGPGAADVVVALRTSLPVPVSVLNRRDLPRRPGLYAWWCPPGTLPGVAYPAAGATRNGTLELAYIGISGSLRDRFGNHLGSSTGQSTLRRALGAWLGPAEGWQPEFRSRRVQHVPDSKAALTAWMTVHLSVTWVEHPTPRVVEASVIGRTPARPELRPQPKPLELAAGRRQAAGLAVELRWRLTVDGQPCATAGFADDDGLRRELC